MSVLVGEKHHQDREPENFVAAINIASGEVSTLSSGADFYAYPRISPDGQQLCWIQWQHPNMPWDCTQLWRGTLSPQGLTEAELVACGDNNQAIFQPVWSPDNQLYYVTDKNNWWNIHRADGTAVLSKEAEFATPLWQFGMSTYDFIDANTIGCLWTGEGQWHSWFIDITSGQLREAQSQYSSL